MSYRITTSTNFREYHGFRRPYYVNGAWYLLLMNDAGSGSEQLEIYVNRNPFGQNSADWVLADSSTQNNPTADFGKIIYSASWHYDSTNNVFHVCWIQASASAMDAWYQAFDLDTDQWDVAGVQLSNHTSDLPPNGAIRCDVHSLGNANNDVFCWYSGPSEKDMGSLNTRLLYSRRINNTWTHGVAADNSQTEPAVSYSPQGMGKAIGASHIHLILGEYPNSHIGNVNDYRGGTLVWSTWALNWNANSSTINNDTSFHPGTSPVQYNNGTDDIITIVSGDENIDSRFIYWPEVSDQLSNPSMSTSASVDVRSDHLRRNGRDLVIRSSDNRIFHVYAAQSDGDIYWGFSDDEWATAADRELAAGPYVTANAQTLHAQHEESLTCKIAVVYGEMTVDASGALYFDQIPDQIEQETAGAARLPEITASGTCTTSGFASGRQLKSELTLSAQLKSITFDQTAESGNLLLVWIGVYDIAGAPAIGTPSGWTSDVDASIQNGNFALQAIWKISDGTETSVTVTSQTEVDHFYTCFGEYRGPFANPPLDQAGESGGVGTTRTATTPAQSQTGNAAFGAYMGAPSLNVWPLPAFWVEESDLQAQISSRFLSYAGYGPPRVMDDANAASITHELSISSGSVSALVTMSPGAGGAKTASGTPTMAEVTASGTVLHIETATGTPSIDEITASGTAGLFQDCSGTPSIDEITATGNSARCLKATGTPSIAEITATGTAIKVKGASGTPSTDEITATGQSSQILKPSGTPDLATITATGTAFIPKNASGAPNLDEITASGVAGFLQDASGTPSTDEITASGVATAGSILTASGTPSIDEITASGNVIRILGASGAITVDEITAIGTIVQTYSASGSVTADTIGASGVSGFLRIGSGTPEIAAITAVGNSFAGSQLTANGNPSLDTITTSGASEQILKPSGAPSLDEITASGTVIRLLGASGNPSLATITANGQIVQIYNASGAIDLTAVAASGTANLQGFATASGNPAIDEITASGNASVSANAKTASGTPTLAEITTVGVSTIFKRANGTPNVPELTASGTVIRRLSASGAITHETVTANGTVIRTLFASGAVSLIPLTASGVSSISGQVAAFGTPSIPEIDATGTITQTYSATGTITGPAVTASGQAIIRKEASGSISVSAVTGDGAAVIAKRAVGSPSISAVTALGAAYVRRATFGTPNLETITANGNIQSVLTSIGAAFMEQVTANGAVSQELKAFGTPSLSPITSTGTVVLNGVPVYSTVIVNGYVIDIDAIGYHDWRVDLDAYVLSEN